ncbi:S-adenosyl-L-methionine-dependent methyltransferase [Aspergillus multicolor]|uniref:S-adenosyl-L-methionine-dependent methyltransferase n=1 Tax=Aspergillus multicolor TaxID=41759 RepID=UPI003CCE267B
MGPLGTTGPTILSLTEDIRVAALQDTSSSQSPATHAHLLSLIDKLRLAVETPTETARRLIYQPPQNAAIRVLIDLGIFEILLERGYGNGGDGVSVEQLAQHTGAEKSLITRLMRVATALGLAACHRPGVYAPTNKTEIMTRPLGKDGARCLYDMTMPALSSLPAYFCENKYEMPSEYNASPMRFATGQSQFEWLGDRPEQQERFNRYMVSRRQGGRMWFEDFPFEEAFLASFSSSMATGSGDRIDGNLKGDGVFIVDIGGNEGHDLLALREQYPHLPGKLILQDLPAVVDGKDKDLNEKGIEVMAYNFFKTQPVKGAKIYYLRSILHDWPDSICVQILSNIIPAMSPDSRILIVDFVLPDTDTPLFQASLDIQMMCIGAGVERSRNEWKELLESVGLEIKGIWGGKLGIGMESVIEVGLASSSGSALGSRKGEGAENPEGDV